MIKMNRRRFLATGATAGAALGVPWLASLAERAGAQVAMPNLRFVLVTIGHSIMPESGRYAWLPSAGPIGTLPRVLEPLAPFRDRMAVVGGVDNAVIDLVSSNGHNASSRTFMTCMPHADALDSSGNLIATGMNLDHASDGGGPSIEYVMADALGGAPLTLRIGERNGEHRRTFRLDGSDDYGQADPTVAFDRLFGSIEAPPMNLSPRERLALRRNDIMNTVQANYRALANRVGAEDRVRLEQHADLIRSFQEELTQTVEIVCDNPELPRPPGWPSQFETGECRNDDVIVPTHNSLIATALGCSSTRVVSLHFSAMQGNRFPFLNGGRDMFVDPNWHGVVHHDGGTDEERYRAMGWYFDMLADLLAKLDAVPEGEGTLLDNTIVVFTSTLANSAHGTDNLPFLFFGGSRTGLATGQTIDYRNGTRRKLGDVWTTCLNLMGIPATSFGWTRDVRGQPTHAGVLEELFA